ncbi:MAG: TetR/AcrR family transcriptional regulator [Gemmatimonadetes bacterium]|jgi:AcrR family transcriptional regulator|nr:TetR/AcrR family transcriptional regulator [Gemmatimonadota bacterium]MBT6619703.1 TetR/AcrR family transcriptional regulator [Gemmatimonadota bacterium]MBT7421752.1 TetR/AcrR family transcriptional regulator [Gemmatimonadota bacterium]MBT7547149.1 TetR/AcrR family transcriptional regulator [Gemmatimonadota bacterium]MDE0964065.1 TetR/AcrR family transcriptional regulator [Candidatus Latescibacterota bacterium]
MRKNKKNEIVTATVHLMARQGVNGTSVRQIATAAGVTEGALYRHFKGKDDLCQQAYFTIVADMASTKEMIALSTASVAEKVREWVRVSYDYYDQFPDAFSYVFFTEHAFPQSWQEITTRQSRIFTRIIAQMQPTHSELALSHFSGVLLNVPRLINEGSLPRPALQYTDEVTRAIYRVFDLVEPTTVTPRISVAS